MFQSFDLTKFGKHLRELRTSLGYTQKDVGELSGLTADTLRRIENGEVVPRYDTIIYLSHVYKKDLLTVLKSYSSANSLFDFYYRLDHLILHNDRAALQQLNRDFDEFLSKNPDKGKLVNITVAEQFKLMLSGIETLYDKRRDDSLGYFQAAMKISHPTFEPDHYDQFKYTEFEKRILLTVASTLSTKPHLCISMLHFCLKQINDSVHATTHEKILRIKVYANIAYNYHRIDEHQNALVYANEGISYCNKHHISYGLPHLLYRKGVAKYFLNQEGYLDSLELSICMLEILGAWELAENFKKTTWEKYNIAL